MLRLKGCPRCQGDMYLEPGPDGNFWACLQCGNAVEARFIGDPLPVPVPVAVDARTGASTRA